MPANWHLPPPSIYEAWPEPNYIGPSRRSWMPVYAGLFQAVSTVTVVTRLWLRAAKKAGPLGLDDALLFPAWLASIAFTVFTLLSTEEYGSGTHVWDVPMNLFEPLARAGWAAEVCFLITTCCTKCSILFFYRRLTKGSYNRRWKYAVIAAIAVTVAYSLTFTFMLIFACSPTEAYWKAYNLEWDGDYECHESRYSNVLSGVMSVVSDLYSVVLPCVMLHGLDAPRRQKIALNVIFSLGLLVVAAGSIRTYWLHQLGHSYDLTWTGFNVYIWAQLEVQLSLICASAPALRVFFRRYLSDPISRAFVMVRSGSRNDSPSTSANGTNERSATPESVTPLTTATDGKREQYAITKETGVAITSSDSIERELRMAIAAAAFDFPRPPAAYPLHSKESI